MILDDMRPELLSRYLQIARLVVRHGGRHWLPDEATASLPEVADEEKCRDADLAADLEAMGPTFVKFGQLLSTRPDLVPARYIEDLKNLRSGVKAFSTAAARSIFEEEIGVSTRKAFREFDDKPFAAASLSQVHRARLRDGSDVVVKIQRPDIRDTIRLDLDALDALARLVGSCNAEAECLDLPGVVDELRKSLSLELDFDNERANLKRFQKFFGNYPNIVTPAAVDDLSSSRVLTMEYLPGTPITDLSPLVRTETDGTALAREFFDAYLHQVLVEGIFHADPHPGNLLMTPERKIGVLDFGMVGRFNPRQQRNLTKLLLAIGDSDGVAASSVAIELGTATDRFDPGRFEVRIGDLVTANVDARIGDLNFGLVVMHVCRIAAETGLRLPHELTLLGKTLLNLDEVGTALDPEFNPYEAIRQSASGIIAGRLNNDRLPNQLYSAIADTRTLAEKLPRQLSAILEHAAGNKVRLTVDVAEMPALTGALRQVANRLTVGIVLAALIVGAALLMRVETEFTLFGYPGLAIVLFLLAAAGGFWFAISVLVGDARSSNSP